MVGRPGQVWGVCETPHLRCRWVQCVMKETEWCLTFIKAENPLNDSHYSRSHFVGLKTHSLVVKGLQGLRPICALHGEQGKAVAVISLALFCIQFASQYFAELFYSPA